MKQDRIVTASPIGVDRSVVCRANASEPKRERIVLQGRSGCAPVVVREYMPPWCPVVGAFVSVENGWGQRVRAEVMSVPSGPAGSVTHFGVRLFAYQQAPWLWLALATRWILWREEA